MDIQFIGLVILSRLSQVSGFCFLEARANALKYQPVCPQRVLNSICPIKFRYYILIEQKIQFME